jgi:hypothetical protein
MSVKLVQSDRSIYYCVTKDDLIREAKMGLDKDIENLAFDILEALQTSDYPSCSSLKFTFTDYLPTGMELIRFDFDILSLCGPSGINPFVRASSLQEVRKIRFDNIGKKIAPLQVVLFFRQGDIDEEVLSEETIAEEVEEAVEDEEMGCVTL